MMLLVVSSILFLGRGILGDDPANDLLYNWRLDKILKLDLPKESFQEKFFEKQNEADYRNSDIEYQDEFGLPLVPADFEAAQTLPVESVVAAKRLISALNDVVFSEKRRLMVQHIAERLFMSKVDEKFFAPKIGTDPLHKSGYFEGDIKDPRFVEERNAIRDSHMKWPGGVIPYVIGNTFDHQERSIIARAIEEYHKSTCIRFVPRSNEIDFVFVTRREGCFSMIGRDGGQQLLSLGDGCMFVGIIIHEFMHAVGFWHEQSRADRDNYVTIMWENIQQGQTHNFAKYTDGRLHHLNEAYDYNSIMHYGPYDFTKYRNRPTILPKQRNVMIGQRSGFSQTDVRKINKLYQCGSLHKETCEDTDSQCRGWAELGECKKNPKWMHTNCRRSCNQCRMILGSAEGTNTTLFT